MPTASIGTSHFAWRLSKSGLFLRQAQSQSLLGASHGIVPLPVVDGEIADTFSLW
jgi:hypothetical protein